MNRKTLAFVALAVSMLYGVGFAAFSPVPRGYAVIGAVVVALAWIAVGTFGKPNAAQAATDRPPYGTPPQDRA